MGFTTMLMGKGYDQPRNSIQQVIDFLEDHPFQTEGSIQRKVWGYYRLDSRESNKKYADLLRRGVESGKVSRVKVKVKGIRSSYFYFITR
jgi:hypothetical protein